MCTIRLICFPIFSVGVCFHLCSHHLDSQQIVTLSKKPDLRHL